MITQHTIDTVLTHVRSWSSDKKIIVGIEGYSGTGKSTLLGMLQKADTNILPVHRDDFLIDRDEWNKVFSNASNKSSALEYVAVDTQEMIDLAEEYKKSNKLYNCLLRADESASNLSGKKNVLCTYDFSKNIMIIEGVFLFHPKLHDHIFDYRIVLDTDQEAADERRRRREMAKWGDKYFPDTHPDSYFRLLKIAYNNYLEKYNPCERADLIVRV